MNSSQVLGPAVKFICKKKKKKIKENKQGYKRTNNRSLLLNNETMKFCLTVMCSS